jgi:hypothetical protein
MLALLFWRTGRSEEALAVLCEERAADPGFLQASQPLV